MPFHYVEKDWMNETKVKQMEKDLVSEAALARKQRFLDLKKEHGGTAEDVTKHFKNLEWTTGLKKMAPLKL